MKHSRGLVRIAVARPPPPTLKVAQVKGISALALFPVGGVHLPVRRCLPFSVLLLLQSFSAYRLHICGKLSNTNTRSFSVSCVFRCGSPRASLARVLLARCLPVSSHLLHPIPLHLYAACAKTAFLSLRIPVPFSPCFCRFSAPCCVPASFSASTHQPLSSCSHIHRRTHRGREKNMRHVFYISSSYAALIYALTTGYALFACLYMAAALHWNDIVRTSCGENHYEFWPSISATVGDKMPERQTWQMAFALGALFRLGASISLFSVFWQRASRGMEDMQRFRSSWKAFLSSNAFLALLAFWVDTCRLIGAAVYCVVMSEPFTYHSLNFCTSLTFCIVLHVTITVLVRRSQFNMSIYATEQDAAASYAVKRICLCGEVIGIIGVMCCDSYHLRTCANGSFSLSSICEWIFFFFSIVFDGSAWFDLKQEGWWLSGPPIFYQKLWAHHAHHAGRPTWLQQNDGAKESTKDGHTGGDGSVFVKVPVLKGDTDTMLDCDSGASAEDTKLLTSPARTSTGDFFLDNNVILHSFSFCSAPSQLSLWICDVYWAHMFFEMAAHLIQHMYFMPLISMSLSWELSFVLVLGAPCLLRITAFRRWATGPCTFAQTWLKPSHVPIGLSHCTTPMYVLFYALASFSHFHQVIRRKPVQKIFVVAVGPLLLSLALYTRFLYPSTAILRRSGAGSNDDSHRMIMTMPLGLVLCMLLRVQHVSLSPIFTDPFYGSIYGILLGLIFTTIIYRHAMMGTALKEKVQQQCRALSTPKISTPTLLMHESYTDNDYQVIQDLTVSTSSSGREAAYADCIGGKVADAAKMRGVNSSLNQMDEGSENTAAPIATLYTPVPQALLGVLWGCITGIGITFFHCPNYIPRMVAVEPFPANLVIAGVFTAGLYYSTDVLPLALVLLHPKGNPGVVRRALCVVFGGSWVRFGVLLAFSTTLLLFATRQTNFTYEVPHDGYPVTMETPRKQVDVKYWEAQETFWGSKHLAFMGGLGFTFCIGVLFPFVMEVTWVHQRDRRFAKIAEVMSTDAAIDDEGSFFFSFELTWLICVTSLCILYALCISYPFVPMAWLVREKSRPLILAHVGMLYLTAWTVARRIRNSRAVAAGITDVAAARKQRTIPLMVVVIIVFSFVCVFGERVTMGCADASFPANKKTAIQFQEEVLHLHRMLIELRKAHNIVTDPYMKNFEKAYYQGQWEYAITSMGKNVTESKDGVPVDPKFHLTHLSHEDRVDVWGAAQAMTFFSGAIWTIHFGLDNYNVDSFSRIVEELRKTKANVIGLLESDSMHLSNGNRDLVDYVSYHLGFRYTDYGPTVLDNTYGCALLTRYPILDVRRYVLPSPLGELSCVIHAVLDVYGLPVHTYVGHFGNTEHWADGLLQSQFLGQLVLSNPGPSMWLGYLVTHPGMKDRYQEYTDPKAPGKFRDAGLEMYRQHPWTRLWDRGGYEEELPVSKKVGRRRFDIETKFQYVGYLEEGMQVDSRFRRPPPGKPPRHFYYKDTGRYTNAHPRFEFMDRYCQYCLYKTGATADEVVGNAGKLYPYQMRLFDWWRVVDHGVDLLSDTEIQVIQLAFEKRT
ncbi:hypothetical protein, conserved [Leishmania tarentolae]|uniref:Uncharacterized protein n=1 Tax=Leishmania tarentolae TaxID=5689 RepID=A0A640KKH5_LEITA|nr:hypothetical protein, conserved [Leishmania tarentolae]